MNPTTLYQLLECPVCYSPMKPPIRQCKIGHTFCDSCRQRITSCPICRGNISSSRAFHLEKISLTTAVCEKCNEAIPLHSSLSHKETCLNGSGDTNGEKVDSLSDLSNHISYLQLGNQIRENNNFTNINSDSDEDFPDQEDCISVSSSSENHATSSDDDQNHRMDTRNRLKNVVVSSCEDEDNFSNGEYDAGNDGDESGEADSSLDEEEDVEDDDDDDVYEGDDSDDYEEEEDVSEDDDISEEDDDVSEENDVSEEDDEEEDEVSENSDTEDPDSYYSNDDQQTSDDTSGECNSSDSFFTTDEFDVSD